MGIMAANEKVGANKKYNCTSAGFISIFGFYRLFMWLWYN